MASGVACAPECVEKYEQMKIKKAFKYLIFKIEKGSVVVETEAKTEDMKDMDNQAIFDDMKGKFPKDEARYAIFDCPIIAKSGMETNKLIFIMWNSDDAPIKSKMLYASSKDAIRNKTKQGVDNEFQATDAGELDFKEVRKKAGSCE
mmetsp:Transcript_10643/g.30146  ORF Transcript_10643/g.30146 Transcript_10643/m.30146 type:complete len:147 (+) Transcript_10643:147-587(+)